MRLSLEILQIKGYVMSLTFGQSHVGHIAARLKLLRVLDPLREIIKVVGNHAVADCLAVSYMSQVRGHSCGSLGTCNGVALHAGSIHKQFFAALRGCVSGWRRH